MKLPLFLKVSVAIAAVDQLAKIAVVQNNWPYQLNTGGAFSLFAGQGWFYSFSSWLFILLLTFYLFLVRRKPATLPTKLGWALLVGGAAANTLDRLLRDGVIDFLQVGSLPAFNFADVAIVLGLVFTLIIFTPPQKPSVVDKPDKKK